MSNPSDEVVAAGREAAFVAQFAQRVAARDLPPSPPPHGYDQESLEACIAAALPARFRYLDPRRARTFARVCYALMAAPRLHANALSAATATARLTLYRALPELIANGLLASQRVGRRQDYFLTRDGEDWLLTVTR
ncbi:hypothetical protein SAMN02745146_1328 [Hymenobacter daecheongensis DSM 21074]|uniref:Uncharacterized protein n=1 Tax=Hymenobacter daecheongensis DSM 21074 TaxID=1121955 RepID=A0A1M6D095_9BACT|nr:hypothetical protein [Hymenobacter daecheongensis]SHI66504.1 hypothetical protein SAMN02745146_1328 [Hymenobacter daecheongensis DSM 21074]